MSVKANRPERFTELFYSLRESPSSTIVATYTPSVVSSSHSRAAAAHSERRTSFTSKRTRVQWPAVSLVALAEVSADALRVRLVVDALGVAERALELRVGLARRLVEHAQRFVDSASEADVLLAGGLPVNLR